MGGFIRKLNKLVCFPFVNLSFASQGPSQREPRRLEGKDIFPSPTHTKQNVLDSSIIGRQLKYALYDNLYPEIMSSKLLNVSLPDTILLKCHPLQFSKLYKACLGAQLVKNPPAMWRPGFDPWVGKIPWRREHLPTPVFWPGEFHGLYRPQGGKDTIMFKCHFSQQIYLMYLLVNKSLQQEKRRII